MILRPFTISDAPIILSWMKDITAFRNSDKISFELRSNSYATRDNWSKLRSPLAAYSFLPYFTVFFNIPSKMPFTVLTNVSAGSIGVVLRSLFADALITNTFIVSVSNYLFSSKRNGLSKCLRE